MTGASFRHALLILLALVGGSAHLAAQQPAKVQTFPSAEAAAAAFTDALKKNDRKALAAIWGDDWRDVVPANDDEIQRRRMTYIAAWDESHKLVMSGDKAVIEVGRAGWTLPVPIVKDGSEWRFDIAGGVKEMVLRRIGYNERGAIQTLLAIVDAENDYASLDPMKTGAAVYARRLLSSPGKKDGLHWEAKAGEPPSPLGPAVAHAQTDGKSADGRFGYYYRLLYSQGAAAPGGARDYIVGGRMIGGFAAIAWPVKYGVSGVMTFMVSHNGTVYQRDLGPQTAERAAAITGFNPDKDWAKADTALP